MCIWLLGVPFCQWILTESVIRFRSSGIPFHLGVAVGPLAFRFIPEGIAFAFVEVVAILFVVQLREALWYVIDVSLWQRILRSAFMFRPTVVFD